jgi:HAMP domain-containing protein
MPREERAGSALLRLRSSVRLPWLCTVLTLLLLAAAAFVALDRTVSTGQVPAAVLGSQTHLTEEYAQALAEQYNRDGQYATEVAEELDASPDIDQPSYFTGLAGHAHPWRSLALVDTEAHKVLAGTGIIDGSTSSVLSRLALPESAERAVVTEDGVGVLRIEVPLESSPEVLVLTAPLGVTASGGGQAVLVGAAGRQLAVTGTASPGASDVRSHALRLAADGHSGALTAGRGSVSPEVFSYAPIGLSAALDETGEQALASAPGASAVSDLGLGLLVQRPVTAAAATGINRSEQQRVALAGALGILAIALFAGSLLWFGLIGPIRRLAKQSRRIPAVGVRDQPSWSGEARDLGRTMHRLAVEFSTEAAPARRAAPAGSFRALMSSGVVVLCVALVPVLGWACAVTYEVYRAAPVLVPGQVATDQADSTAVLAAAIQARLAAAGQDLGTVAASAQTDLTGDTSGGSTAVTATPTATASARPTPAATAAGQDSRPLASAARLQTLIESVSTASTSYSSVYVVDRTGKILARTGESPRVGAGARTASGTAAASATLVEGASSGHSALLYAVLAIGGGDSAVAEFSDAQLLTAVQHDSLGTVNLSDGGGRVLLSSASFTAYATLSGEEAAAARAARTRGGRGSGSHVDGSAIVEAGTLVPGGAPLTLTTDRATAKIAVSGVLLRQSVQLLAMLAITAALLCGGWIYIMVLMPLRRLERRARAVAEGDYSEAVVPQRADEIGQLSRALDLLRRAARRGRGKPVPAQRNTASAWSETSLLPRLSAVGPPPGAEHPEAAGGPGRRRRSDQTN